MRFLYKTLCAIFIPALTLPAFAQLPELDWHKPFTPAEPGARVVIGGIKTSLDGNIVIYGQLTGAMDVDPGPGTTVLNPGNGHAFFAKYDQHGELLWARQLPMSIHTWDLNPETGWIAYSASFAGNHDFDPGAGNHSLNGGFGSMALVRLDANGNFKGANDIMLQYGVNGLAIDKRGRVVLAGFINDPTDFDPTAATMMLTPSGGSDGFVAVYDNSLHIQQAFTIGGIYEDGINCLRLTSDGFTVGGRFQRAANFDPGGGSGVLTTKKVAGFVASYAFSGGNIALKNAFAMGAAVDEIGVDLQTSMSSISGLIGDSVDVDPGPGVVQLYPVGKQDVFVSHTKADGSFGFGKALSTGTSRPMAGLMPGVQGAVFYAGSIVQPLDMNVGQPNGRFTPLGAADLFICKMKEDGSLRYGFSIGAAGATTTGETVVASNGAIILAGSTTGTLDLDPGSGVTMVNPNAGSMTFLARYKDEHTLSIAARERAGTVEIHSSGRAVIVDFSQCSQVNASITVSDLSGRKVLQASHNTAGMRRLDLGDIAAGFYLVTVRDGATQLTRKISLQ